jgi:hypothetical protein
MKKSYLDSINNTSEEEIFITTGESRYLEVHNFELSEIRIKGSKGLSLMGNSVG